MISRYVAVMFLSVTVASVSQVLLKKSTFVSHKNIIMEYINPYVICGYSMLLGSMLLTVYAYSGMEYKNGPVIESLGNVIVLLLSYFIFKEKISKSKLVGIGLIIAGIVIFNS
jgi:drug/metabolite transporter (DMT)-like permease